MRFWVSALQAGEALAPSTSPVLRVRHTVSKRRLKSQGINQAQGRCGAVRDIPDPRICLGACRGTAYLGTSQTRLKGQRPGVCGWVRLQKKVNM